MLVRLAQMPLDPRRHFVAVKAAIARRESGAVVEQIERVFEKLFGALGTFVGHRLSMPAQTAIVNLTAGMTHRLQSTDAREGAV